MLPFQRPLIPRTGDAVSGTELGFIAQGKTDQEKQPVFRTYPGLNRGEANAKIDCRVSFKGEKGHDDLCEGESLESPSRQRGLSQNS